MVGRVAKGHGVSPAYAGSSLVSQRRIRRGYGSAPRTRGGVQVISFRRKRIGVSPAHAGRGGPTLTHCVWARENTPARSGVGEGPAAHGWPGRGEAPKFASGNGAFNIGGQKNPRKRVAPPGTVARGVGAVNHGGMQPTKCGAGFHNTLTNPGAVTVDRITPIRFPRGEATTVGSVLRLNTWARTRRA